MAVTISIYNHTSRLFANGANDLTDDLKVMLCTAATFDPANATLAAIAQTEVAAGNGYTTGGVTLSNVTVNTENTNGARLDADDASWAVTGGALAASFAILYNATDTNSPPLAFIDFDGSQSASPGTDFKIVWSNTGIFNWTVTP